MLDNNSFIRSCIRDFSDEMDEIERSIFIEFLNQHPQKQAHYNELKSIWSKANITLPNIDSDKLERKLRSRINVNISSKERFENRQPKKRLFSAKRIQLGIVSFILLMAVSVVWFGVGEITSNTISKSTHRWQRSLITLGDGSKVWLNELSTIEFPEQFSETERTIILSGEAFFEVTPDSLRPFVIESNGLITRVLGTSFNIKSYADLEAVEVTVRTGKVSIENYESPTVKLELLPNEKGTFDKDEGVLSKSNINNPEKYFGWINNFMVLENETLNEVAQMLESRFEIEIQFSDPAIGLCQLSGKLKDNSLTGILDAISTILNLTYEVKGRTITFSGNKCVQK
ncbi:FecR family protein [Peijinzhouia sedimentorum]